jgi:4-hydroxy-tetrahydrodipicolinate reductase
MEAVRVAIAGAGGRMGHALIEAVLATPALALAAALDIAESPMLGHDAGEHCGRATGVTVGSDVDAALAHADVLVDFTRPEGTLAHLAACARHRVAAVVGTTGLSDAQKAAVAEHGRAIPIVFAANMSVGRQRAPVASRIGGTRAGPAYDIEIVEMHHRHKVDAPSGTALRLGKRPPRASAQPGRRAVYARHGITGERKPGTIGFAALRGGDVVGEHAVVFARHRRAHRDHHRATSRQLFAAVRCARSSSSPPEGAAADRRVRHADVLGLR